MRKYLYTNITIFAMLIIVCLITMRANLTFVSIATQRYFALEEAINFGWDDSVTQLYQNAIQKMDAFSNLSFYNGWLVSCGTSFIGKATRALAFVLAPTLFLVSCGRIGKCVAELHRLCCMKESRRIYRH